MSAFWPDDLRADFLAEQLEAACEQVAGLPVSAEVAGVGAQVLAAPAWLLRRMDDALTDGRPILRCPDWSWTAPRPAAVSLTDLHVMRCWDHVDDLPGMSAAYPTVCDQCRRPGVGRHAISYVVPPLIVLATLCDTCVDPCGGAA